MWGVSPRGFSPLNAIVAAVVLSALLLAPAVAFAANGFAISVTKTASPTTYTAANQTINYTYVVTDFSTRPSDSADSISVTDNKIASISCPKTKLAAGSSMTCTGSYMTTAADVTAGSVTNQVTVNAKISTDGVPDTATGTTTITFSAQPSWTLSKSASPTSYTAAGQTISYSYTLVNTGNVSISAITVSDDKVATVNCGATTLAVGASTTCSGTYTTTSADVAAGSITNHASAHGTPGSGTLADASAQATVTYKATAGSITIIKDANGGNGTFTFNSTIAGASSFTLTTVNGTASRSFVNLTPGTYKFTETNLPLNWKLTALSCTGDNGGAPTTVDLSGASASVGLDGGESITCTFTNTFDEATHREQTQQVIRRFLAHRMSLLLSEEPDRARFLRRVPGALWGDGNNAPFSFSGSSNGLGTEMTFSTSLRQIARAEANANRARAVGDTLPGAALAYAKPRLPSKAPPRLAPDPGIDVWMEAHYLRFGSRLGGVDNDGNFGLLYLGADRLLTPSVLVGALVQFDWMNESSAAVSSSVSGKGAMAGPYVSLRLTPNLFFDARGAWGLSANNVDPFGQYTDNFSTDRWLAHAKLTGNWHWGGFRLTPSVALDYIQEHQRGYTDTQGVAIPGQTLSLGRFSFGPEIARRFIGADGTTYEPLVSLTGQWDFDQPELNSIAGLPVSGAALYAQAQAGLLMTKPSGFAMRVVATYDGIGDNALHAYGGQIWINLPLN